MTISLERVGSSSQLQNLTDSVSVYTCVHMPYVGSEHCRINPPLFLAECRKKHLNQGSFVLYFALFAFLDLCLVFVVCFNLSTVLYFPA